MRRGRGDKISRELYQPSSREVKEKYNAPFVLRRQSIQCSGLDSQVDFASARVKVKDGERGGLVRFGTGVAEGRESIRREKGFETKSG